MSKSIAGRNASNVELDSFKRRANKTRDTLTQFFGPAIEDGDKNVFSQARVYEFQARQEGFSSYASVKAAKGVVKNGTPNPAKVDLLKQMFPHFYFNADKIHNTRGIEAEFTKWNEKNTVDPNSNLVAIYGSGTNSGDLTLDTDITVPEVESGDVPIYFSCPYPQFEAAVQICPIPAEWADRPFSEYLKAHVDNWEKKLLSDVELKVTHVLSDALKAMSAYKEQFARSVERVAYDSFNDVFMGECYVVLKPYIHDDSIFHIAGKFGKYLLLAFEPIIFDEGDNIIADYLLRFALMDTHSFSFGIEKGECKEVSCHSDWFEYVVETTGKEYKEIIRPCRSPDYEKGTIQIPIPEMVKPGGWGCSVDMIHDKGALDELQRWLNS